MSTNDRVTCPGVIVKTDEARAEGSIVHNDEICKKEEKIPNRKVSFPEEGHLVTEYFEPANPWHEVPATSKAQLAAEYLEACRHHQTQPIESVLQQIWELPENVIGGSMRAPRLTLSDCSLIGTKAVDALEAVFRKVQFRKLELDHVEIDDEGAEAIFDMIEYYESTTALCILGPREYGIRGWQAASWMIKKSVILVELEARGAPLAPAHATVLARSLRPLTCRLRSLALTHASLAGDPLLSLVVALKTNNSVRELRLGDNKLTAADAVQLSSLLLYNTRIQLLDLSNNFITDAGVTELAGALVAQSALSPPSTDSNDCQGVYESRGLAFLVLWNNQLTRNCAMYLANVLHASHSLCVLNVGRNALGSEAVRQLCGGGGGGRLVSLGLQAARLAADAARPLADLVRNHTTLQRLDLRDNKIGVAGLQTILNALKDNTTLTQIDLDEPPDTGDSAPGGESAAARVLREIRAACRRNEAAAALPPDCARLSRKISLTCHTAAAAKASMSPPEEERRRLRSPAPSPAPSPAGSPIPSGHPHSRFSVTRVTPERESSTESSSPSTPTRSYCPTASRFKVIQVSEPQVHVQPTPKKSGSRFSVTRNYDSMYNPSPSPTPSIEKSMDEAKVNKPEPDNQIVKSKPKENEDKLVLDTKVTNKDVAEVKDIHNINPKIVIGSEDEFFIEPGYVISDTEVLKEVVKAELVCIPEVHKSKEVKVDSKKNNVEKCVESVVIKESDIDHKSILPGYKEEPHVNITVIGNVENNVSKTESTNTVGSNNLPVDVTIDNIENSDVNKLKNVNISIQSDSVNTQDIDNRIKTDIDDVNSSKVREDYGDKIEELSHNEIVDFKGDDEVLKSETKLVKSSVTVSEIEKVETEVAVTVKSELNRTKVHCDQNVCKEDINKDVVKGEKRDVALKQIEAITEDLGNLIQEMHDLSTKTRKKHGVDDVNIELDVNIVPGNRDNVVLKKNKSESSLDSPDLEVSRLMRKPVSAFCDSSSSLEISGSSLESLNMLEKPKLISRVDTDLRCAALSTESSVESTSEITPVNLNMSVSSNESVSPIIFGGAKKIHGSLSSLEASVSSIDSARQEKVMVTSADSGIEYSLQNPSDVKEDSSSNEGTLTYSSSFKEPIKKDSQDTLTSPKRTSSLLDVPALKSKGLERMRKISWVAPSPSFHIPKPEEKVETKLPSNLEKLLNLFQKPSSLFSRGSSDDEKKSNSSTPPRKDSSLTSSFWSWGSGNEKIEKDDKDTDSLSEATDSTLSERVQVSFVDESFSKKLDSKTPSTDTENTLSEFQSLPNMTESVKVTEITTDEKLVQNNLDLSVKDIHTCSAEERPEASDNLDLIMPNDLNKTYEPDGASGDQNTEEKRTNEATLVKLVDEKLDIRPRSFASVLKSSGSENSLEKQASPDTGQPVDKLPSKIIRGIKENISPENTLTSSITTRALANELNERQIKNKVTVNIVTSTPVPEKSQTKIEEAQSDMAPIANIDETCDVAADDCIQLAYIDDVKDDDRIEENKSEEVERVDLGKDALSYLMYEKQPDMDVDKIQGSLAEELRQAEIKELLDLSPELVIDDETEIPEVFAEAKGRKSSPVIPERAKMKKSNSLEDLTKRPVLEKSPKAKTIAFKVPESTPRDIPERRTKLRTRSGSSPKSLPECLNKPCPLTKMDSLISKKKKKVSSLGKMARDSLLALNMSEEEIAEFRRSYKLTSLESLRSLESVSENSQSGTSADSRCRACLRMSQESLMSLDSITEDCRCLDECEKRAGRSNR